MKKQEENNDSTRSGAPFPDVYVVTRDRRRTSDRNFKTEHEAKQEAGYWIRICREHDPKSKVTIVKTNKPKRIR